MANLNAPRGFVPIRTITAASWNAQENLYYIPSTDGSAYYPGDAVKSAAVSDANGVMGVQKALGTDTVRGVITGVLAVAPGNPSLVGTVLDLSLLSVPASKARAYYVLVADSPETIFELQDDGLNTLTATAVNKNASFTVAVPTSPQQYSASVLNTASVAVTQALNLKIMGLVQRADNAFGINAKWQVMFNQHELMGNTAGI
jgi:hypothetical protein